MALTNHLNEIADAIREKTGSQGELTLAQMPVAIRKIPTTSSPGSVIAPAASNYPITQHFSAIGNAIRSKTGGTAALTLAQMPSAIRSIVFVVSTGLDMIYTRDLTGLVVTGIGGCTDNKIVIPATVYIEEHRPQNCPVKEIGEQAFANNTTITGLLVSPQIEELYIKNGAFKGCTNLTSIALGGTTMLAAQSFLGCTNLAEVDLGSQVTHIAARSFENCTNLTSVVIPATTTSIASTAFLNCKNLILEVDSENPKYRVTNNCLISGNEVHWVGYVNASIPTDGSVTTLYFAYTYRTDLTSVTIPEVITVIGNSSFDGCENLPSVTLPNNLIELGFAAFQHCNSLTSMTIPAKVNKVDGYAFGWCEGLKTVTFKGTPSSMDKYAFHECFALTDIYVPWSQGAVANAPWGATNATIHYNHTA